MSDVRRNRLQDTLQQIKQQVPASRNGVKNRRKLELLRHDLADVIADIPDDAAFFDFTVSKHDAPRLWIDPTAFVTLSDDGSSYQLIQNQRSGPFLLFEGPNRGHAANAVIDYVAEILMQQEDLYDLQNPPVTNEKSLEKSRRGSLFKGFLLFLLGVVAGVGSLVALAWFRQDLGL